MVHCRRFKDYKCSYTGGRCILDNPKTIEQYKLCSGSVLAKDYSEMNRAEKAFVNSIENIKRIVALETKIKKLEMKILANGVSNKTAKMVSKIVAKPAGKEKGTRVMCMPPPDKKGVAEILKPLGDSSYIKPLPNLPDGTEPVKGIFTNKKGGLIHWLRHLGK